MQSEQWSGKQNVYCEWGLLASLSLKSIFGYEEKENYTSNPNTHAFQYKDICAHKTHVLWHLLPVVPKPASALNDIKSSLVLQLSELHPRLSENLLGRKPGNLILIQFPDRSDAHPGLEITGLCFRLDTKGAVCWWNKVSRSEGCIYYTLM